MIAHVLIGCGLAAITTFVHAAAMIGAVQGARRLIARRWIERGHIAQASIVAFVVVVMYFASFIESAIWAATYLIVGAISGVERAMYFSMVTYTTLGYGDVTLDERWRLLSSLEAANGIIMFGWSTALIFAAVHMVYIKPRQAAEADDSR